MPAGCAARRAEDAPFSHCPFVAAVRATRADWTGGHMTRQQILAAAVLAVGSIGLAGTTFGQASPADQSAAPAAGQSSSSSGAATGQPSATPSASDAQTAG